MQIPLSFLVGTLWAAAILIGRGSGTSPLMLATLTCLGTGTVGLVLAFSQNFGSVGVRVLGVGYIGGVINGLGLALIFAMFGMAASREWNVTTIVPATYTTTIIMVALGAAFWFSEGLTYPRIFGFALIIGGIWLLK